MSAAVDEYFLAGEGAAEEGLGILARVLVRAADQGVEGFGSLLACDENALLICQPLPELWIVDEFTRGLVPVDDVVTQVESHLIQRWRRAVELSGLVLEGVEWASVKDWREGLLLLLVLWRPIDCQILRRFRVILRVRVLFSRAPAFRKLPE